MFGLVVPILSSGYGGLKSWLNLRVIEKLGSKIGSFFNFIFYALQYNPSMIINI